jgi:hypothetical protein
LGGKNLVGFVLSSCVLGCGRVQEAYVECVKKIPEENLCIAVYDPVCDEYGNTHPNPCESCKWVERYSFGECIE